MVARKRAPTESALVPAHSPHDTVPDHRPAVDLERDGVPGLAADQGRHHPRQGVGPGAARQSPADRDEILHTAAAAKLLDALEDNPLLAPTQSSVVPLPHQLHALNKALSGSGSGGRIRYLLADEVGLGKTIEAGLILRELKLCGMLRLQAGALATATRRLAASL